MKDSVPNKTVRMKDLQTSSSGKFCSTQLTLEKGTLKYLKCLVFILLTFFFVNLIEELDMHSICQQICKTQQWSQDWKRSVFIPIPKKGNPKECSNYCTIALISHTSKVMLKILQAKLQQYMNHELPDVQDVQEKAEEPEIKLPTSTGSSKKQEGSRKKKKIYLCFID